MELECSHGVARSFLCLIDQAALHALDRAEIAGREIEEIRSGDWFSRETATRRHELRGAAVRGLHAAEPNP